MFGVGLRVPIVWLERLKHMSFGVSPSVGNTERCLIFKKRALLKTQVHRGPIFSLVELSMRGIM
jgi:hypothetical protein